MTFYLAARYSRRQEMLAVAEELTRLGHHVTSRWISGKHEVPDRGGAGEGNALNARFAREDLEDVQAADCLLAFTEEPRSSTGRGGRHVEFGIALGMGKLLAIIGPQENVFHYLPGISWFHDWTECLAYLRETERQIERGYL